MNAMDKANAEYGGADAPRRGRPRRSGSGEDDQEFMLTLAKGLAVIESFSAAKPRMTLSEVSRRVGLSPASARRVLRTLHVLGYATCTGTRYELTPRVLQLGCSYLSSVPLAGLVQPRLSELTEKVGGNCALSVLDGPDVVFIACAASKHIMRELMMVGSRLPAHTTSAGKVLLADLERDQIEQLYAGRELKALTAHTITSTDQLYETLMRVRAEGWAINDRESLRDHRSITVPVRLDGRVVAAVTAGAEESIASEDRLLTSYLPHLREVSSSISELLGMRSSSGGATPWGSSPAV